MLKSNLELLNQHLTNCQLCPWKCGVNRAQGQLGRCRTDTRIPIAHIGIHTGEEPPISGQHGSGTVFFANCNLACVFCQNHQISQGNNTAQTRNFTPAELAQEFLKLQDQGVHNINLVSPTHVIAGVAQAIFLAKQAGLQLPIVYNSNGYDLPETIQNLAGLIDIYLPDLKYSNNKNALTYSNAPNYVQASQAAITAMYQQVGNLKCNQNGIAQKGLLVRHLVLPHNLAGSKEVLEFLSTLSPQIFISIMAQYSPQYNAKNYPLINRKLTQKEYDQILDFALELELDLENCFIQELESNQTYIPDFTQENPF